MKNWIYYNHAILPGNAPHEQADLEPLRTRSIWKSEKGLVLFARWTSEFDCVHETSWWYCIKDTLFDINKLKAKRRYEINKGRKNFDVQVIDPGIYIEELYKVLREAFCAYPMEYRPSVESSEFVRSVENWKKNKRIIYGAFEKDSDKIGGFAVLIEHESYAQLSELKTMPILEKLGINAAIMAKICEDYNPQIEKGYYLSDGERSIFHETNFQDYLEKYFGFRKAYAKLNIKYRRGVGVIVAVLYPLRKGIRKLKGGIFKKLYAVLLMEEIVRGEKD